MKLQGKTVIIVGGGRGIGQAIAERFAEEGAQLMIAARTVTELQATARQIEEQGGRVDYVPMDVRLWEDVQRILERALGQYGRVDVLVNCAAVHGPIGPVADAAVDEWIRAVETNLFGTFMMCRAVLPQMMAQRYGKIINFSGGGATSPLPRLAAYGVSKTAVVRLTETLAHEVLEYNIQVNAIAPGVVDTHMQDDILAAGDSAGELTARIRKLRETGEGGVKIQVPVDLALFLASDDSQDLTGKLISAPHDPWRSWGGKGKQLSASPMYTLRRMDPFTIKPLMEQPPNE